MDILKESWMHRQKYFIIFMKIARSFFKQFDSFTAKPSLRANEIPLVSNLCTGIFSFLILVSVAAIFGININQVLNYQKVQTSQTNAMKQPSEARAQNISILLNVHLLNKTIMERYFNITIYMISGQESIPVPLQWCTPEDIQSIGTNYQQIYQMSKLYQFLCPADASMLNIFKSDQQAIQVVVSPCLRSVNPLCESTDNQFKMLKKYEQVYGFMTLNMYFLDRSLVSNSKYALQFYLNPIPVFWFSNTLGSMGTIFLGTYEVKTDTSILPFENMVYENGSYVSDFTGGAFLRKNNESEYGRVVIYMSTKLINVQRQIGKFDQVLSYIGGLFSIIISFFSLFLMSFNEVRYQIMIAESMFNFGESGEKVKQTDFNFFLYSKYMVFDWFSILFCKELDWEDCKKITATRNEVNSQIDVNRFFRKLEYLEAAAIHRMTKGEADYLALAEPSSIEQVQRSRVLLGYYDQIIKGEPAVTLEDVKAEIQMLDQEQEGILISKQRKGKKGQSKYKSKLRQRLSQLPYNKLYEQAKQRYPQILKEAQELELNQEYHEIEDDLIEDYQSLNQINRYKILMNTPLKILFRLGEQSERSQQYSDETDSLSHSKSKQK